MQPDDTAHESEMLTVASLFREAVQVTPPSDEVVSMVALPDELLQHIFKQACNDACNVLDPRAAVALSRASHGIRAAAQALLPQLKAYHQAAAALCLKLRERRGSTDTIEPYGAARSCARRSTGLLDRQRPHRGRPGVAAQAGPGAASAPDRVAPRNSRHRRRGAAGGGARRGRAAGRDLSLGPAGRACGRRRRLGAGRRPGTRRPTAAQAHRSEPHRHIGDAGLVALAPALRRLPALEWLGLAGNPFGDEGLRFLVGAPPPVHHGGCWVHPPWSGVLTKLEKLNLDYTQITDAGCRILEIALNSGALPTLEKLILFGIPARPCMMRAVSEARSALWCTARAQSAERAASASTRRAL